MGEDDVQRVTAWSDVAQIERWGDAQPQSRPNVDPVMQRFEVTDDKFQRWWAGKKFKVGIRSWMSRAMLPGVWLCEEAGGGDDWELFRIAVCD